jgi:hypothetical protein
MRIKSDDSEKGWPFTIGRHVQDHAQTLQFQRCRTGSNSISTRSPQAGQNTRAHSESVETAGRALLCGFIQKCWRSPVSTSATSSIEEVRACPPRDLVIRGWLPQCLDAGVATRLDGGQHQIEAVLKATKRNPLPCQWRPYLD